MGTLSPRRVFAGVISTLAIVASISTDAHAVDLDAQSAFFRTGPGPGSGDMVEPQVGQAVYPHLAYQLTGAEQVTVGFRATINGNLSCGGDINLPGGVVYWLWCDGTWTATLGTHTLRWELDTENVLDETDESNNVAEITFTVGFDLEAQRAFLRTGAGEGDLIVAPQLGQEVFVHIVFSLTAAEGPVDVAFRATVDGEQVCTVMLGVNPGVGWRVYCFAGWTATPGTHVLRWELDPENELQEDDETNNAAEYRFTTGADVDVQALRAYLRTGRDDGPEVVSPELGQDVFVHVDARIEGVDQSIPVRLRALLDDVQLCSGTNNVGNESQTIWCNGAWTATSGTHTLRWELDTEDAIAESDEDNNAAELNFTTGATPTTVASPSDTPTRTRTPSRTGASTRTATPTRTRTPMRTGTATRTPRRSATRTLTPQPSATFTTAIQTPGDVNGDGRVDRADIDALIAALFDPAANERADVNADLRINVADLTALLGLLIDDGP